MWDRLQAEGNLDLKYLPNNMDTTVVVSMLSRVRLRQQY